MDASDRGQLTWDVRDLVHRERASEWCEGEGIVCPEAVFEAMQGRPSSDFLAVLPPDEVFMQTYHCALGCRTMVAVQRDPDERSAAEEAFEALIAKYDLADRLEFTARLCYIQPLERSWGPTCTLILAHKP